ncbi:MAG: hypothetical protein CMB32_03005 [Euryarchaeota archaeon]|nr:hypothetical protein [Euryarchaeota archaeon]
MNKLYSLLASMLVVVSAFSQCEIDYDFGDAGFGVSPDASIGETFMNGEVGIDYYDVLHILVPQFASDVDEIYPPTLPIDSLYLDGVTIQDTTTWEEIPLSDLGLEVFCNNNGDSGNPCSFLGGQQYCASLQGVPTMSGVYQLNVHVVGWLTIDIPFSVPITYSTFLINIHCNLIEEPVVTNANGDEGTLGSVDITPLDGVNVVSYEWIDDEGEVVGTDQDIDGLFPGVYSLVIVTDACTSTYENIIVVDSSIECNLEASYVITDEIPGVSLGSIDLTVNGANGNAEFLWTDDNGITVGTDEDLLNVNAGTYHCVVTDEDGCILLVDDLDVSVNSVDDVELNGFSIMPNPANDFVNISLTTYTLTDLEVIDSRGRKIYNSQIQNSTILHVNDWEQGVYFITISNELGRLTSRLVIKR